MAAPVSVAIRVLAVVDRVLDRVERESALNAERAGAQPALPDTTTDLTSPGEIYDHLSNAS